MAHERQQMLQGFFVSAAFLFGQLLRALVELRVPDPADPVTHVWAEGTDLESSEAVVATYVERVARTLP